MAKLVLLDSFLSIASNNLSAYTKKVEGNFEIEDKDVTTYGSGGAHERLGGLFDGELSIDFLQDFAAAALDSIMWPLMLARTPVAFEIRPTAAVVGTSNPKYTGFILVKEWKPIQGSVGDEATVGVSFPTSGIVTRATA